MQRVGRVLGAVAAALVLGVALLLVIYRFVPATVTPLMLIRHFEGEGMTRRWVGFAAISPNLRRAVVASEDAKFCLHYGFDWASIEEAWANYRAGERLRGASTITQQTAKNLLLWPGKSWLRKGLEVYPTILLELLWPKQRILETYLNIVEWGHGIYGAEAAAEAYFHHPARSLTMREAALLAAVLPNPRRWSAAHPTAYIEHRAAVIRARMAGTPDDCL